MAARKTKAPRSSDALSADTGVRDIPTATALGALGRAVRELQSQRSRDVVTADLIIGANRVRHGLGRDALGYTLTPTTASAGFAHCLDDSNPNPELEIWITVIGSAQTGARIEVY